MVQEEGQEAPCGIGQATDLCFSNCKMGPVIVLCCPHGTFERLRGGQCESLVRGEVLGGSVTAHLPPTATLAPPPLSPHSPLL